MKQNSNLIDNKKLTIDLSEVKKDNKKDKKVKEKNKKE